MCPTWTHNFFICCIAIIEQTYYNVKHRSERSDVMDQQAENRIQEFRALERLLTPQQIASVLAAVSQRSAPDIACSAAPPPEDLEAAI